MNMFKPVKATDRESYIKSIAEPRRSEIVTLDQLIQKTVPTLSPNFLYNMLGYGTFKYVNYKKDTIDWPVIALASQKNYMSLYVCCITDGVYLAEKSKHELGKVSVGKSCIRFKKFSDLHLPAVEKLLKDAAKNPGLIKDSITP
jgi:hypothetical protein